MLYETPGIVLSLGDLGESDRIASILTRENGLVHAVVKGARKPRSKLSPLTQPFSLATFQLYQGRSLDRVTQVSLKTTHPGIVQDYRKLVYARLVAETVLQVAPEREKNADLFQFLAAVLASFELKDDPWPVAMWAELGIMARAGFMPSFERCALCGSVPQEKVHFEARLGGILCGNCAEGREGAVPILVGTMKTMDAFAKPPGSGYECPNVTARGKVREEAGKILLAYVQEVLGKRLKSASLLESIEASGCHNGS